MSRIHERIVASSERRGLSRADYAVLCAAGYRINLPPARLARHVRDLSAGEPEPVPSVEELEHAIEDLCERGLLAILCSEDLGREAQRAAESVVPELRQDQYRPGEVDFTPTGYLLFRDLILEVFGAEHVAYDDSGFVFDRTSQTFLVLAPTRDLCLRRIEEIKACPGSYAGVETPFVIAEVSEPKSIGSWMPNRFVQLTQGFRSTVRLSQRR